jgi:UDP-N-acetylglucosamine transferase subunit ALG13
VIFVTVGTQLPFDRLVRVVDEWAARVGRRDVFAQIGPGDYAPRHIQYKPFITPPEFKSHAEAASLIIGHAGMGTILSALNLGKPVLVLPRQAKFKEHRNDHQLATARRFREQGRIMVAMNDAEMTAQLDALDRLSSGERIGPHASPALLNTVRAFIES